MEKQEAYFNLKQRCSEWSNFNIKKKKYINIVIEIDKKNLEMMCFH
jgi:hypothetical protein